MYLTLQRTSVGRALETLIQPAADANAKQVACKLSALGRIAVNKCLVIFLDILLEKGCCSLEPNNEFACVLGI